MHGHGYPHLRFKKTLVIFARPLTASLVIHALMIIWYFFIRDNFFCYPYKENGRLSLSSLSENFERWKLWWFLHRVMIIVSGTRRSSRRRVARLASSSSRLLRRNHPTSGSGEEILMVLRSSLTEIAEKSEMGWFVWFPREWPRSINGSLWWWEPELGWDLDSFDWFSSSCAIEETESM